MGSPVKDLEEFYLKLFKVVVLVFMSVALVSIVVLLLTAAQQYFQSPKEPAPAQKAPHKEVEVEDLKRFLLDREKDDPKQDGPKQLPRELTSLRYQEQANALFRCAEEFGKKVVAEVVQTDDARNAQALQNLRSNLEQQANQSPLRGEPWVQSAVAFTCAVLANETVIALKKEQKLKKAIFFSILEFHGLTWDSIQREKVAFEDREKARVESERAAEVTRVIMAKALAVTCAVAAASLFALFMLLAIYLLASKAESDLREIGEAIRALGEKKPAE